MRKFAVATAMLVTIAFSAPAYSGERTITGAEIGAGAGAVVAGPVGAVVGGGIGAVVGGPRLTRGHRYCWHDRRGVRHCRWR